MDERYWYGFSSEFSRWMNAHMDQIKAQVEANTNKLLGKMRAT